ncbi:MAG: M28 family peptidase [Candidatus Eisenbacteria bacterium]
MRRIDERELLALVLFLLVQLCFCASAVTSYAAVSRDDVTAGLAAGPSPAAAPSYDVSIVEVRDVPFGARVPWLVPPHGPFVSGVAVADRDLLRSLAASGAEVRALAPYDETKLYYMIEGSSFLSERVVASAGEVLWHGERGYLVSVDDGGTERLGIFRPHARLLSPFESDLAPSVPSFHQAHPFSVSSAVEDFWIGRMVDSVSEGNLYDHICALSGATAVDLPSGPDTLLTRYSYHSDCLKAGEYLYSQFDDMGIDVEYDYYFGIPLRCVEFKGAVGYAVGNSGKIYRTVDSGCSWESQLSGTAATLWRSSFVSQDSGWVVGLQGTMLKTQNGGAAWTPLTTGTGGHLFGVEFLNARLGWFCGDDGLIRKTMNGGQTWTTQPTGTALRLYDIEFADSLHGWAVGNYGKILHTFDSGANWQAQTNTDESRLYDVCFVDSLRGWAVGASGRILRTSDGGGSWQIQTSGVTKYLYGVCFVDSLHGWVVGGAGLVLFTEDGGAHWTQQNSSVGTDLYSASFVNLLQGWAAGTSSIIRTADSGINWISLNDNLPDTWVNVIATLPGTTSPSQIYVVCGHYDSISDSAMTKAPGADDNASGTGLVLEAARVLKDYAFGATIRFACFSGEEQGLLGSYHYAGSAYSHVEDIEGVLNFDMIAYGTPSVYLIGNTASAWLVDYCIAVRDSFVPELAVSRRIDGTMRYSDHSSFWDRGYSALCGIETGYQTNPYYHRTTDTVDHLTIPFAADVTRLAVASMASLAELDTAIVSAPEGPVASHSVFLGRNFPNPFNPVTHIPFTVTATARPSNYVLAISEPAGRIVKILQKGRTTGAPLAGVATWDGTDENGNPVVSGVYLCSLRCEREIRVQKIVLAR